jgi:hypothetical protein
VNGHAATGELTAKPAVVTGWERPLDRTYHQSGGRERPQGNRGRISNYMRAPTIYFKGTVWLVARGYGSNRIAGKTMKLIRLEPIFFGWCK